MRRLLAFLALAIWLSPLPATAQAPDPAGSWALQADGRIVALIELHHDPRAPGGWAGAWIRPEHLAISLSHQISGIIGPTVRRRVLGAVDRGATLDLTIEGRTQAETPDVLTFHLLGADRAEFGFKDFPLRPVALIRAEPNAAIAPGWEEGRAYSLDAPAQTNAEMTAIFDADQADRQGGGAAIDWSVVGPRDQARQARTLALLNGGVLHSGDDYWHAAFVFQHGDQPNDYLFAHTLAVIAAARGRADAAWIAAATLDRYLQNIGRPQIYGTQFRSRPGQPPNQEPYDRTLVSDALREALGVPPQAAQETQRAEFEAQAQARAAEARRAPRP
jgi:hypothetical protein